MKRFLAALLVVVAGGLVLAGSASAEKNFKWLCKPGKAVNPCEIPLDTTSVTASGSESVTTPKRAKKPPVDCFYVYPTVSSQEGPNADLSEDPEIDGIAEQQAAQFSRNCRMFAPIYPQFTVPAILNGQINEETAAKAYNGVKAAWNEYLRKYNRGRGIVLIGHSQGTGHLGQLIEDTFDKKPKLRKRLVSGVLIGGNVYVPKGKLVGGQFKKVPGCSKPKQLGCVIASSGFLSEPPADANFGRVGGALVSPGIDPAKYEVMCVNPARLDGSKGILKPIYNTEKFPGIYGPLLPDFTDIPTQWVSYPKLYRGTCERADGAHWLQVDDISTPADERVRIGEPLGRTWGTHLTEVNDSYGNLLGVVKSQSYAYAKKVRLANKKKKKSHRKPK